MTSAFGAASESRVSWVGFEGLGFRGLGFRVEGSGSRGQTVDYEGTRSPRMMSNAELEIRMLQTIPDEPGAEIEDVPQTGALLWQRAREAWLRYSSPML